ACTSVCNPECNERSPTLRFFAALRRTTSANAYRLNVPSPCSWGRAREGGQNHHGISIFRDAQEEESVRGFNAKAGLGAFPVRPLLNEIQRAALTIGRSAGH